MSNVIIFPESLSASVFGSEVSGKTPTELYVAVMVKILAKYPHIIGQKETHFTTDSVRAGQYTGTTRNIDINGRTVYIKTGLSTKDKWKGIEKTCQLGGLTFEVSEEIPKVSDDFFDNDFFDNRTDFAVDEVNEQSCQTELETDDFFGDYEENCTEKPLPKTLPPKQFIPTSAFAFHSEYYIDERNHMELSCTRFDEIVHCSDRIYVTGHFFHDFCSGSYDSNTVFEITPEDWGIRAIISDSKYFTGAIAVNKHGIFRINGNKFYLFDMNGKMKSKVAIKPSNPSGMYIYDSKIYSLSAKGKVYEYDILNPSEEKIIWSISDIRDELNKSVASYLMDNNFVQDCRNTNPKFTISYLTPKRICANNKRIVVGFELLLKSSSQLGTRGYSMLYVSIDPHDYRCSIIDVSDEAEVYKVFSFDMEKDIMWWYVGDQESKHLFSTEIKPLDIAVKRNPQFSYYISSKDINSSLESLKSNFYFDGKSASGIDNLLTAYFCADGTAKTHNDYYGYQSCDNYILGNWMYRPNMGQKIYSDNHICFIPHKKESFESSSGWHKIDNEDFEIAYLLGNKTD